MQKLCYLAVGLKVERRIRFYAPLATWLRVVCADDDRHRMNAILSKLDGRIGHLNAASVVLLVARFVLHSES